MDTTSAARLRQWHVGHLCTLILSMQLITLKYNRNIFVLLMRGNDWCELTHDMLLNSLVSGNAKSMEPHSPSVKYARRHEKGPHKLTYE